MTTDDLNWLAEIWRRSMLEEKWGLHFVSVRISDLTGGSLNWAMQDAIYPDRTPGDWVDPSICESRSVPSRLSNDKFLIDRLKSEFKIVATPDGEGWKAALDGCPSSQSGPDEVTAVCRAIVASVVAPREEVFVPVDLITEP